MEKNFYFEVNLSIELNVEARNKREARAQLKDYLIEYLTDTKKPITKKEAVLIASM